MWICFKRKITFLLLQRKLQAISVIYAIKFLKTLEIILEIEIILEMFMGHRSYYFLMNFL